jgi:hypothetical protein
MRSLTLSGQAEVVPDGGVEREARFATVRPTKGGEVPEGRPQVAVEAPDASHRSGVCGNPKARDLKWRYLATA